MKDVQSGMVFEILNFRQFVFGTFHQVRKFLFTFYQNIFYDCLWKYLVLCFNIVKGYMTISWVFKRYLR